MRGLPIIATMLALAGCTGVETPVFVAPEADAGVAIDDDIRIGQLFVESREFRRQVLEDSLTDWDIGYAQDRLLNYAVVDDGAWDGLPELNPTTAPVTIADLGGDLLSPDGMTAIVVPDGWDREQLLAAGRLMYERYPLGIEPQLSLALTSREAAADYGLWTDDRDHVGGVVRFQVGSEIALSRTCSSCHGRTDDHGQLVPGASNPHIEIGRLSYDYYQTSGEFTPREVWLDWGPGHADVTADATSDPTGIPDLRPLRYQNHINVSASVTNDLAALAVRIDTLIITNVRFARPPRKLVFALTLYLWSLGQRQPTRPLSAAAGRGQQVFEQTCARCHRADGTTAPPIAASKVGTDPSASVSEQRGTGLYRIPSLFMVADRQRLLHRSNLGSLEAMFDPARLETVPGHVYGLDLAAGELFDLLAFIRESPVLRAPDR